MQQQQGKIHQPLINLKLTHVVPDELHLMLRVTDVLTRNLITAAITHDISMTINRPANYDILTGQMLNTLLNAIRSCGVPFNVWADRKNVFDCTSLMGKDK